MEDVINVALRSCVKDVKLLTSKGCDFETKFD